MNRLEVGQAAPEFTAETPSGPVALSDLVAKAQRGVIVYFYPQADTPACTAEACDFRDNLNSFKGAGYTVVGISPDSVEAIERFQAKESLNFPMASDSSHQIMEQWGVWGEKKNYGRTYIGVIRSTFVVGPDGNVALAQYNVKATGHVARLRKALGLDT